MEKEPGEFHNCYPPSPPRSPSERLLLALCENLAGVPRGKIHSGGPDPKTWTREFLPQASSSKCHMYYLCAPPWLQQLLRQVARSQLQRSGFPCASKVTTSVLWRVQERLSIFSCPRHLVSRMWVAASKHFIRQSRTRQEKPSDARHVKRHRESQCCISAAASNTRLEK